MKNRQLGKFGTCVLATFSLFHPASTVEAFRLKLRAEDWATRPVLTFIKTWTGLDVWGHEESLCFPVFQLNPSGQKPVIARDKLDRQTVQVKATFFLEDVVCNEKPSSYRSLELFRKVNDDWVRVWEGAGTDVVSWSHDGEGLDPSETLRFFVYMRTNQTAVRSMEVQIQLDPSKSLSNSTLPGENIYLPPKLTREKTSRNTREKWERIDQERWRYRAAWFEKGNFTLDQKPMKWLENRVSIYRFGGGEAVLTLRFEHPETGYAYQRTLAIDWPRKGEKPLEPVRAFHPIQFHLGLNTWKWHEISLIQH